MPNQETLNQIHDDIALVESMLDQAQAHLDAHKHLWSENTVQEIQQAINAKRFRLAFNKLLVEML